MTPETFYHVYNRGNNRQKIFFSRENYLYFLRKVRKHLLPYSDIIAYCLMPNHFHFLVYSRGGLYSRATTWSRGTTDDNAIDGAVYSRSQATGGVTETNPGRVANTFIDSFRTMLSSYTRAINKQKSRTGSLFQQNTKFKALESNDEVNGDPFICFHYIHQNPMRAGLVARMEDWEMSSFMDYAGLRKGALCNKKLAYDLLEIPEANEEFIKQSYDVVTS